MLAARQRAARGERVELQEVFDAGPASGAEQRSDRGPSGFSPRTRSTWRPQARSQRPGGLKALESRLVMTASLAAIAPQTVPSSQGIQVPLDGSGTTSTPRTSASLRGNPDVNLHLGRIGTVLDNQRLAHVERSARRYLIQRPDHLSALQRPHSNHHCQIRAVHLGRLLRRQGHHPNREQLLRQRRLRHAGRSPEPGRIREQRPARHALPCRARSAARV